MKKLFSFFLLLSVVSSMHAIAIRKVVINMPQLHKKVVIFGDVHEFVAGGEQWGDVVAQQADRMQRELHRLGEEGRNTDVKTGHGELLGIVFIGDAML